MCLFCAILLGLSGKLTTTVQGMTRNGARCESDFIDPLLQYSNRQHMHVCMRVDVGFRVSEAPPESLRKTKSKKNGQ